MPQQFSKLDKARAQIVLDHPFVASILLRHPLTARKDIPTLGVDARGKIYYNPDFVEKLSVPELVWGLSHEVFHRVGQHVQRMQNRKHRKWNIATDAWINDTLDAAGIGTRIPNCVDMKGSKDKTCEDIYANLPDQPSGKGKGKGKGQGQGQGQGDGERDDGLGDDLLDEGQPLSEAEAKELEAQIKIEVAEAAQAAKMRGKLPAALQEFANSIIDVKTPWYDILERFMTEQTKQDFTWARPNRRYIGAGVYLPSVGSQCAMGEIVVQVDVSGSVSEQELNYYGGHLKRICEQCNPTKVHVIYTDTRVVHHDTFDNAEDVAITFRTGGGTDMTAGYSYIEEQGIEPAVFVTLTDGYTPFPDSPQFPSVWCISSDVVAPSTAGESIHFEME
jgi:predicted metal-dependent peptidase